MTVRPMRAFPGRRFAGFGDGSPFDNFDFSTTPTTASGAIDWGNLVTPPIPVFPSSDLSFGATAVPSGFDFASLAKEIVGGANTYYGAQAQITNAQTAAALAKARGQAAVAVTKAGGANAVKTAGAGLPSPTLLLFAALGLGAILILKK